MFPIVHLLFGLQRQVIHTCQPNAQCPDHQPNLLHSPKTEISHRDGNSTSTSTSTQLVHMLSFTTDLHALTQSNTWAHVAFSMHSGDSKRKRANNDSIVYEDATQLPVGSIKWQENDKHAALQPQKPSMHVFHFHTLSL
jgi:hypothetical protein